MAIVKLALGGLAGVEKSDVELGSAVVVYDPRRISAAQLVSAVNQETQFTATLAADASYRAPPAPAAPGASGCTFRWWC